MKKMKRIARERECIEETLLEKWTTACRVRRASPISSRTIAVIALIGNPMKKSFFVIWIALLAACSGKGDFDLDKVMQRRPDDSQRIFDYEDRYASNPGDFETALGLGRRYTLVSMSRKGINVLKKAQAINPEDPRPYKYLAIGHVNAHYQYAAALKALKKYVEREPDDLFAYNFMGYIYYRKKQYAKAADAFEKAIALNPDNCYADFYLAYTYAWLYDKALKLDPRRSIYKKRFHRQVARTRSYAARHPLRVAKLNQWLAKN